MEPRIDFTSHCPNCEVDLFLTEDHECPECGFTIEIFNSHRDVITRYRSYLRCPDAIVNDPVRTPTGQWLLGSTRMCLI